MNPSDRVEQMISYLSRVPHGTAYLPFQTLKHYFRIPAEDVAFKTIEFAQRYGLTCEKLDEHTWKFQRARKP